MKKYIYLTSTPEALVASMLPPEGFGMYLSTGTKKRNRGQNIFFEVDLDQIGNIFDMESLEKRCVAKEDGSPKSSVYLSVYRVLEMVPTSALKSLYLTTDHGCVLELKKAPYDSKRESVNTLHLYQELCPVTPLVVSDMTPSAFLKKLTDGSIPITLPKLFFVELKLGELAANPLGGSAEHLPYPNIGHMRDCLEILRGEYEKHMKTVQRVFSGTLLYRTIESGFYVGSKDEIVFYPYPTIKDLEDINYEFFRDI
ncbi:MAG TPA: hypothetical protein PLZ75_13935 [Bacteroidales bacterium]|jgi:hypothetical protein|nr:hypothetical protein [Bacteroidales bacterium]HQH25629.1 hypothetical protein [Bacteroidales bacterium]